MRRFFKIAALVVILLVLVGLIWLRYDADPDRPDNVWFRRRSGTSAGLCGIWSAAVLLAASVVLIAIVVAFIVYPLVEVWGQARKFRSPRR